MKNFAFTLCVFVPIVVLLNCEAIGQFAWTKDVRNPVFQGGASGAWDFGVAQPCVLFNADSARYEMWYGGAPAPDQSGDHSPDQIGFAVSSDGITWQRDSVHNPVLSPTPGAWDSLAVYGPCVIRESGQYKMWYTGARKDDWSSMRIGYATSPDGRNWTKYSGNPVLKTGTAAWEAGANWYCCVIPVAGGYKMFYDGMPPDFSYSYIGLAVSTDGIVWQRDTLNNPVLKSGTWDSPYVWYPRVLKVGDVLCLMYCGENSSGDISIGLATSTTGGISWKKYAGVPVLTRGVTWDNYFVLPGFIVRVGKTLHMWYTGGAYSQTGAVRTIGHATSPIDSLPKITLSQDSIAFGGVPLTTTKKDSVLVSNPGTDTLRVPSISNSKPLRSPFSFSPSAITLAPRDSVYLVITFAPKDTLDQTTYIVLRHNTLDPPESVAVSGKGVIATAAKEDPQIAAVFALHQNYPNPFNPATTISFSLPRKSFVSLKVFDALGREVWIMLAEELPAGTYARQWNPAGLASGVYLCRLVAGSFVDVKKMLLVK